MSKTQDLRAAKEAYNIAVGTLKSIVDAIVADPYTPSPEDMGVLAKSAERVLSCYASLITVGVKL
jgi:hypothetical protein